MGEGARLIWHKVGGIFGVLSVLLAFVCVPFYLMSPNIPTLFSFQESRYWAQTKLRDPSYAIKRADDGHLLECTYRYVVEGTSYNGRSLFPGQTDLTLDEEALKKLVLSLEQAELVYYDPGAPTRSALVGRLGQSEIAYLIAEIYLETWLTLFFLGFALRTLGGWWRVRSLPRNFPPPEELLDTSWRKLGFRDFGETIVYRSSPCNLGNLCLLWSACFFGVSLTTLSGRSPSSVILAATLTIGPVLYATLQMRRTSISLGATTRSRQHLEVQEIRGTDYGLSLNHPEGTYRLNPQGLSDEAYHRLAQRIGHLTGAKTMKTSPQ